jgi:hypothetical protein
MNWFTIPMLSTGFRESLRAVFLQARQVAVSLQNESTPRAESWRAYLVCAADLISAGYAAAGALVSVSASTAPPHRKACVIADGPRFQAGVVLLSDCAEL